MSVYLTLEILTIFVPLLFSWDRKLQFLPKIRAVLLSIVVVALFYIVGDILFTHWGIWGFNPKYHTGIVILGLPLEEWLFFIVIPYASIFLHETLIYLFPNLYLSKRFAGVVSVILVIILGCIVVLNFNKAYTVTYGSAMIVSVILGSIYAKHLLNRFYLTFLVILIPFFLVNSILTGTLISEEVVWYNNAENLGIRILTVPIEDIAYAFSLILFNLLLIDYLIPLLNTGDTLNKK